MNDFLYYRNAVQITPTIGGIKTMKNFEKATKTQICEKFISEADKVSNLMAAIKMYCQQVIDEETCGAYRGDGANDPDNVPKRKIPHLEAFFESFVKPAAESVQNNGFIQVGQYDRLLSDVLRDWDKIIFPQGFFEDSKKAQSVHSEQTEQEYDYDTCCCPGYPHECGEYPWCETDETDEGYEITEDDVKAFVSLCEVLRYLLRG